MWWPACGPRKVMEERNIVKFVELLVYEYLQVKGYEETRVKFAKETARTARDGGRDPPDKGSSDGAHPDDLDEAGIWYYFADRLDLPELLRQNNDDHAAVTGRRFNAILEVLVKEIVRGYDARPRAPSSVSIVSFRDGMGKRKLIADGMPLPRSISADSTKEAESLDGRESEISELTKPELMLHHIERSIGSHGEKKRSTTRQVPGGLLREGRVGTRVKKLGGHPLSSKGGKRDTEARTVLNKLHFSSSSSSCNSSNRQQRSHENWIPEELRMKMMRRSMWVIKENMNESIAQGSFMSRAKKHSNRSELEIVKTQEKFGTKHQRPCALCMYSFSEVNLVQAVPFKAIVDLRAAWQKTFPQPSESILKTSRTMLFLPQCYNEVKVCAFCSQLFHNPLGYRPTWEMQLARMRERRNEVTREREREYWDPLRFETDDIPWPPKEVQETDHILCLPKEAQRDSPSHLEIAKP